jgi:hypothetical protein
MEIAYARSSSLGTYEYCQLKYYMIYNLGLQEDPNKKTIMGTIAHKVLEILASAKKYQQENPKVKTFLIEECDKKYTLEYDKFLTPRELTEDEVNEINKGRINKSIYADAPFIDVGHKRLGESIVNDIIDIVYDFYSARSASQFEWGRVDKRDCTNFVWIALDKSNGIYDPRLRNVLCPELSFDLPIDLDWAKNQPVQNPETGEVTMDGQFAIKGTIDLITEIDDETLEIVDWKGLTVDTPIPTINGWSTMGDLKVGDTIFDMDGNQTKVLAKSTVNKKPCFKITFDDTSTVICDNEHLWKLSSGDVVSIINLKVNDKINVVKPIQTNEKILPIDPYVLGYWLGDGRNRCGEVCSSDDFVFEEIKRRGYSIGENISSKDRCPSRTIYGLTTVLKSLNLLHNKHIPELYLRASYSQRLDLLRGLMDSDGNCNPTRKQVVFTNCTLRLSQDVKELLLTLGQRPLLSNITKNGFGKTVSVYPISFRPIGINPFLLPRKQAGINPNWGSGMSSVRTITKIENVEEQETQCIMVDSPTSTYLCTNNMIVTHNTGARKNWATGEAKTFDKLCKDVQLMLYYYAAKRLFPDKTIIFTIFFIRDGGPFSLCFDETDVSKIEGILRDHYNEIRTNSLPKMLDPVQRDFRCKTLCHFFKNNWPETKLNMCRYVHNKLRFEGMEKTTEDCKSENFDIGRYHNPGE